MFAIGRGRKTCHRSWNLPSVNGIVTLPPVCGIKPFAIRGADWNGVGLGTVLNLALAWFWAGANLFGACGAIWGDWNGLWLWGTEMDATKPTTPQKPQ